jgi:integrase/recombinase XerD
MTSEPTPLQPELVQDDTSPANANDQRASADSASVDSADAEIALPPPLRADSSLADAVAAFGEYMLRKGFSDNTIKAFRNDLKIFTGFMDGSTRLHEITTRRLEEYLEWMQHSRGKSCSAKTLARRITSLKVFFGWLHGIGVLGNDPAEPVLQQPARTPLPVILRDDEINDLVRAAQNNLFDRKKPDARPYLLVSLLLQTGIKKAECANILVSDVDVSDTYAPTVTIRYADERHAHKNRRLNLHPSVVHPLQEYLRQYQPDAYLFDCTPRNLEYVLDEVGKAAGIRSTQVGFETLRWTCAVRDYRMGMPEERLREKMGLSKISWRETREKIYRLTGQ